jgi:hypothetical protein
MNINGMAHPAFHSSKNEYGAYIQKEEIISVKRRRSTVVFSSSRTYDLHMRSVWYQCDNRTRNKTTESLQIWSWPSFKADITNTNHNMNNIISLRISMHAYGSVWIYTVMFFPFYSHVRTIIYIEDESKPYSLIGLNESSFWRKNIWMSILPIWHTTVSLFLLHSKANQ